MIVSCHLPYFIPYPGYFLPILYSDVFVLLDSVQFPQGRSWVSRNLIKNEQGKMWLSVPVRRKGLGLQNIQDVKIIKEGNWQKKFVKSIETAYYNAPYLEEHFVFIKEAFQKAPESLLKLNLLFIDYFLTELKINTEIVLLSHLNIKAKEPELSFLIARELKAKTFVCMSHKRKFLDENLFYEAGIEMRFIRYDPVVYPQLWGPFIPNLSFLDLLLNCGPKAKELLNRQAQFRTL